MVSIQAVNEEKVLLNSHIIDRKIKFTECVQECYSVSTLDLLEVNITSKTLLQFAITMHHCILHKEF